MKPYKRLYVLVMSLVMLWNCLSVTAFAATTMGYDASATTSSSTYEDNAPINRVFYVKTGSSSASRTLKFQQTAGSISYYMYRNTTKSCFQKYRVLVFNNDNGKSEGSFNWKWTKSMTIKLDKKNTNYTIIVYPEEFDTVLNKHLTTNILKLRPIIYGYQKSPHFTVSTSACITYSETDSYKIAGI